MVLTGVLSIEIRESHPKPQKKIFLLGYIFFARALQTD
jgi:hypothetical protein